jgi:hypothetical protein
VFVVACFGLFTGLGGPLSAWVALCTGVVVWVTGAWFEWPAPYATALVVSGCVSSDWQVEGRSSGQRLDGLADHRLVHPCDFDALAWCPDKSHASLAAEMISALPPSAQDDQLSVCVTFLQRRVPERQTNAMQQRENALAPDGRQVARLHRVGGVERHPDGDRLTVSKIVFRHRLEHSSHPVTEVEGPDTAHVDGIDAAADVLELENG